MPERARIAVAGAGVIGERHAALAASEGLLSAVVDPAAVGAFVAGRHGVPHYRDLDALFASDRPDGVIVATPNRMHVEHGLACVAARIPVLVEKPIADGVAGAEQLVSAASEAGVPLLVGHHRRHNPVVRKARELIAAGRLGRLVAAHVHCWFYKPDDYFEAAWRRQPGAGPLFINLIHDIDLMRHLCGEVVAVQAMTSAKVRNFPVEDTASILVRFASGVLGTLTVSDTIVAPWSWELTAAENPAYPVTGASCYRIGGTRGSLSIPDLGLWRNSGQRGWMEPMACEPQTSDRVDPLVLQIRHFADVARAVCEPLVPGREGLETLRVVEAAVRAAETGTQVSLA